jgi:hypothetical protein
LLWKVNKNRHLTGMFYALHELPTDRIAFLHENEDPAPVSMKKTTGPTEDAVLRVVMDECVGLDSLLARHFQRSLRPDQAVEFTLLAKAHRAIPDSEILGKLLGPGTVLLTSDRVLHNQACDLGLRSYTLNALGKLIQEKLPDVRAPRAVPARGGDVLKTDYTHGPNVIASALRAGLDERALKKYRTRRRRIRSYFGSESNISQVALTVGARVARQGHISGFFLAAAGYSGVKGIRASEGYALGRGGDWDPALSLIHALQELYLLQLEAVCVDLFIIPRDSLDLCRQLQSKPATACDRPSARAFSNVLHALASARVFPCVKGPVFNSMEHKLNQLARTPNNELVPVDFGRIIESLNHC